MSAAPQINDQLSEGELRKRAVGLLSQQIWCWGCDILRPEGNWLLELGFKRIEAPADRDNCSSVYALDLPRGRRVMLRGFGVFYGDDQLGGVFLPRYEFSPRFTTQATLDCPPWSDSDLPKLSAPSESHLDACTSLTLDLIDWIRGYETDVVERLGIEYRESTLERWKNTKGVILPAGQMVEAWKSLGIEASENPRALVPRC